MILDIDGVGMVEHDKTVEWIMDNIMVNSELLDELLNFMLEQTEDDFTNNDTKDIKDKKRKKIEEIEDKFMINLFNQMDKKNQNKIVRTDFENWFTLKMPSINNHDKMKMLGMLCKEFKARDKSNNG